MKHVADDVIKNISYMVSLETCVYIIEFISEKLSLSFQRYSNISKVLNRSFVEKVKFIYYILFQGIPKLLKKFHHTRMCLNYP